MNFTIDYQNKTVYQMLILKCRKTFLIVGTDVNFATMMANAIAHFPK